MILAVIIACVITLCMIIAYLMYYSRAHVSTKILALPLTILISISLAHAFVQRSGRPIDTYPSTEFIYIHHKISPNGKWIYLWADDEETGNRLYKMPYTREAAKNLGEAMSEVRNSGHLGVLGKFAFPDGRKRNPSLSIEVIEIYNPEDYVTKEE